MNSPVKVPICPLSWVETSDVEKDNEIEGSRDMTCLVLQIDNCIWKNHVIILS